MDISDSDTELFDNWGSLLIGVVEDDKISPSENEWTIDLLVNQTLLPFKIDSGAQANIVSENCFWTLKSKHNCINCASVLFEGVFSCEYP